jgi:hypothetical protein
VLLAATALLAGACTGSHPGARPFVGPEPPTLAVWNATRSTLTYFRLEESFTSGASSSSRRSNPSSISSRVGTISGASPNSVMLFPRQADPPPLPLRVRVIWQIGSEARQEAEGSLREALAESTGASAEVLTFQITPGGSLRVFLTTRNTLPLR